MVPEEDMPKVEAIMAKVNGPKRGRTLVAAAVAAGSPGRSAAAAPAAAKARAPSAWTQHATAYAASHHIPYSQALRNSRNTYVPVEKGAAAAPRARSRSVSRRGAGAGAAAAAANPFNQFNNVKPKANATRRAKAAPAAPYNPFNNNALYTNAVASAAANPFNMFKAVPGAAAPSKNKTKRTRAMGPWNALVAEVRKANPGMPPAIVLKLASKQMGIRKKSPLSEFGPLGLNNSNNNA